MTVTGFTLEMSVLIGNLNLIQFSTEFLYTSLKLNIYAELQYNIHIYIINNWDGIVITDNYIN